MCADICVQTHIKQDSPLVLHFLHCNKTLIELSYKNSITILSSGISKDQVFLKGFSHLSYGKNLFVFSCLWKLRSNCDCIWKLKHIGCGCMETRDGLMKGGSVNLNGVKDA